MEKHIAKKNTSAHIPSATRAMTSSYVIIASGKTPPHTGERMRGEKTNNVIIFYYEKF